MGPYGAIFDMDGVLVDSYRAHFHSWLRLAEANGLTMTEEQFAATFGRTSREIIQQFWGDRVAAEGDKLIARWDAFKEEAYRDILKADFPAMDGASELLSALHAEGFRLAIGSSGPPENVRVVVECLPNAGLFRATVNGMEVKHGKPQPDVFLIAAAKIGLQAKHCCVVEDAPAGVAAGKAAGMAVIAITGTAEREKLAAADIIVDSLRQITPEIVRKLITAGCRL